MALVRKRQLDGRADEDSERNLGSCAQFGSHRLSSKRSGLGTVIPRPASLRVEVYKQSMN
jgi:hypothetical protein